MADNILRSLEELEAQLKKFDEATDKLFTNSSNVRLAQTRTGYRLLEPDEFKYMFVDDTFLKYREDNSNRIMNMETELNKKKTVMQKKIAVRKNDCSFLGIAYTPTQSITNLESEIKLAQDQIDTMKQNNTREQFYPEIDFRRYYDPCDYDIYKLKASPVCNKANKLYKESLACAKKIARCKLLTKLLEWKDRYISYNDEYECYQLNDDNDYDELIELVEKCNEHFIRSFESNESVKSRPCRCGCYNPNANCNHTASPRMGKCSHGAKIIFEVSSDMPIGLIADKREPDELYWDYVTITRY